MIALLSLVALLQAGAAQAPASVARIGITVRPDTVTVGDPFVVAVRIVAPLGSQIEFPAGPDSGGPIEMLDPRVVTRVGDTTASATVVDLLARYRMAAWEVGPFPIILGPARVITPDGDTRTLSTEGYKVFARSVLPADTSLHVPKPARDIIDPKVPWWWPWGPILLAAAVLGALFWWWWRRRKRRAVAAEPAIDPYDLAEREFARIEALGLLEAGERGRFVALMVEVLRDYLAARVSTAHPSLTSTELINVMRSAPTMPVDRLAPVLDESDMIKFARRAVTTERAREIAREARAIVHDLGRTPPPEPTPEREAA
jgi:hypothetical protein